VQFDFDAAVEQLSRRSMSYYDRRNWSHIQPMHQRHQLDA